MNAKTDSKKHSILVLGLTGSIASGKSTVGSFFRDYAIPVIDADEVARSLRQPGGLAEKQVLDRFGSNDPKKLRELISKDPQALKDLESILHPLIRTESERLFQFWGERKAPYIVYEAALLIEAGRSTDFDGVILVRSQSEMQIQRLMTRDRINEDSARQFFDAQTKRLLPDSVRVKQSSHLIQNDTSIFELRERTRLLHLEFLARVQRER